MDSKTRFDRACRCLKVDRPPVWLMRQAGRYLPEYRAGRVQNDFLATCHDPKLAADVTMMPLDRFPLDAGIIFSDILVVPEAMGCSLAYPSGGPTVTPTIETAADLDALVEPDVEKALGFVGRAIAEVKTRLSRPVPILGFTGAPFTIACYMTPSPGRDRSLGARLLMMKDPGLFDELMERLTRVIIEYLKMQVRFGADAVQLFDTWAGDVPPHEYERRVLPYHARIMGALAESGVPRILFINGIGNLLELAVESGANVIGLDWRIDMADARRRVGPNIALQGNLDPLILYAPRDVIRDEVRRVHNAAEGVGHIFNLGHGVLPTTPVEGVEAFVQAVLELG